MATGLFPSDRGAVFILSKHYFDSRPSLKLDAYNLCIRDETPEDAPARFLGKVENYESAAFPPNGTVMLNSRRIREPTDGTNYCMAAVAQRVGTDTSNTLVDVRLPKLLESSAKYHCVMAPATPPMTGYDKGTPMMNPIVWRDDKQDTGPDGLVASALHRNPALIGLGGGDDMADATSRIGETSQGPILIQPGVVFCRYRDIMVVKDEQQPDTVREECGEKMANQCAVLVSERHLVAKLLCHKPDDLKVTDMYSLCWPSSNATAPEPRIFVMRHEAYAQAMYICRRLASHIQSHTLPDDHVECKIVGVPPFDAHVPLNLRITVYTREPRSCPHLLYQQEDTVNMLPASGTKCNQWIALHSDGKFYTHPMEEGQAPMLQYQKVVSSMVLLTAKREAEARQEPWPPVSTPIRVEKLMYEHFIRKDDKKK